MRCILIIETEPLTVDESGDMETTNEMDMENESASPEMDENVDNMEEESPIENEETNPETDESREDSPREGNVILSDTMAEDFEIKHVEKSEEKSETVSSPSMKASPQNELGSEEGSNDRPSMAEALQGL